MKNLFFYFLLIFIFSHCAAPETETAVKNTNISVNYPTTKKTDQTDTYHGTEIKDEYRWLEDDNAEDTKAWVGEQNKVTQGYLDQIPFREKLRERYEELFNYPKLSSPFKAGEYYFFYKNDGLQNQSVIYYQKGLDGEPEVFIDPNSFSKEGTTAISLAGFSNDNKYVTYSRQDAGSDWQKFYVMEVATKKQLSDELEWVKFSGASWKDDGFFYSRYPAPKEGAEFSGDNRNHSVYFHKLGDDQSRDQLVYEDPKNPNMYHYGGVTEDQRFFVLYAAPGTDGYAVYYKDLDKKDSEFVTLFEGYKNKSSVVHNIGDKMLVQTDIGAPKYRMIELDINNPAPENWKEIIPETENLLQGISTGGGKLFASYLQDATTRIYQYDYDGTNQKEIKLPGLGSAFGFGGKEEDHTLFYTFTSFIYPGTIFRYDVKNGTSKEFYKTELKFNPADYVEKQIFYTSKDGTKVPMFIVHAKDLKLDGTAPTYLYAYGGFNVSLTPSFSTSRILLLENGGVFAMPNLRGGGEYGEEWHKGGMLQNKQNVFDDFIAAGEYLIGNNYTSKDKLAIAGGSNGGLLVGAAMTQRPDLFAVALPAVGVMDMLRYHKFTVGKGWIPEYGSSDNPEDFKNLLSYSPLHNLKEGTEYPATMVTTADHDDRVVPAHSFKFAAKLQEVHEGENPVLIRIETNAGHGAGKPTSKIIDEQADIWSFVFYNTNAPVKYLEQ